MKSLAKNSLYNIIYKCSSLVFPLVTAAYISRVLLAEGIGKVNSASNIVQYFVILAALGLPTYGTKVIAAKSKEKKELSKAFSELFLINAISSTVCTLCYYIMIFNVSYFRDKIQLFVVMGFLIPLNIINVDWFYQGQEEYRYIMVRSIIVKLIAFILTFLLIHKQKDYIIYAALLVFSNAANYIFNIFNIRRYIDFTIKNISLIKHLKSIVILLSASIAIEIYTLADTTMLTFMSGEEAVGFYTNAMTIIRIVRNLVTAISAVYLPRLSFYYSSGKYKDFIELIQKGIKILLLTSVPAATGIVLVASDFVPLYFGSAFSKASVTTAILAISIVTVAISNFTGYQILVTIGKEKVMFYSTIIGAVTNVLLNYFLIINYSFNGAAIASVITEFGIMIFQVCAVIHYVKFKIEKRYLLSVCLSIVGMILVVVFIKSGITNCFMRLIMSVFFGATVYGTLLILTKNEYALLVINMIRKRKI